MANFPTRRKFHGNAYLKGITDTQERKLALGHQHGAGPWLVENQISGMRKSSDKIGLSTQLGYSTDNVWFYTLMGDLNTQFAQDMTIPTKRHQISNFFAPAYSNIALGMEMEA